ncbi:phosphotransferase family protein [Microbacterium sp. NPDC003461]
MQETEVPAAARIDEAALLAEAFETDPAALRLISREPLGRGGSVAGFEVAHDGGATSLAYVDTSGLPVPAETGLVLEGVARVWTHPADPHLPALVPVAFGGALEVLLRRLGIAAEGAPEMVGYRPGRRAVLRVPADGGSAWIKVVRPSRIERVVDAHRALREAGLPVPAVRGWSPDGVLVIDQAEGVAATEVEWHPDALLAEADRLRSAVAAATAPWEARTGVPARLPWYAVRLRGALPGERRRVDALSAAAARELAADAAPRVVVHGDLHLGQLFLQGTGSDIRISGIIDADTAGLGDAAEDAAAFVSHATASALLTEGMSGLDRIWALAEGARERWRSPRVGALAVVHLLGHALAAAERADAPRARRLLALAEAIRDDAPLRSAADAGA